ncbi:TonB-dependent receptor [Qipengyuania sp. DGS5-3]|uniref:TonB-dependent receptor n=1 Tax=Qipengyuania sp. DGS5-3 TaxID=3349632 RepID=UPI0036D3C1AA
MLNTKELGRVAGRNSGTFVKLLTGTALVGLAMPTALAAQEQADTPQADGVGENAIVVTGIRSSLQSALQEKRNADSLIEVIQAEDIGKLPDQNLAEVLENVTGVQITRTAGVGTGVQIRGTNDNRTAINGVTTLGSGSGRGGINFEDVNAAIISSVEVIKAPEASTIEGAVGGTINLRTIRPLDITDTIATVRLQGEYAELSDSVSPRISASFGDNWSTGAGDMGFVIAASYTEQEATSLRPRVDRDNFIPAGASVTAAGAPGPDFDFLGIQFLNQELENFEFETINIAGSFEWEAAPGFTFFVDGFYNDQERRQDSSRVQGSGVSSVDLVNVPDTFETVEFGSLDGVNFGSIQAALTGTIQPNLATDDDDPNLRFSSDTGARVTESSVLRWGFDWEGERLALRFEASRARADSVSPNLSTTLNFINPNPLTPLDGTSNDNSVPFIYDLTGGALTFGIDFASPFAPSVADLLDPANTVIDAVNISRDTTENADDAIRLDLEYDTSDFLGFITSVDAGYRFNRRSSEFNDIGFSRGFGAIADSPSGSLIADLLVPGPDIFGDADGRELAFRNFLLVDPNLSFSDQEGTYDAIQAAFLQTPNGVVLPEPDSSPDAFFSIDEETHALYLQANFELGILRGNVGVRYVDTSIDSTGITTLGGTGQQVVTSAGYNEWLPRFNVIADVSDDIVLRASFSRDVNRPDFNQLSSSVTFPTSANAAVSIGNPGLAPETVTAFDASIDWYFAPAAVVSVGVFHKRRTNLFVTQLDEPFEDPVTGFRDITDPCEQGGIFNPIADRNILAADQTQPGICVPIQTEINDTATTKQTGIEVAFQYDLSSFEDTLGFASGFGILANYTYQDFSGGEAFNTSSGRGTPALESGSGQTGPFTAVQGLLDFSENAYNVTLYYEKFGLSARARYTWRDAFRTLDTAGGASLNSTFGFPTVTESRGQLNASVTYDVTDNINVGIEGVNLTKSEITQRCVNSGALLCFQGLPDRRITFGATFRF